MTRSSVFVVAVVSIGAVVASSASAQVPAFDVVSIKENTSNSGSGSAGPEGTSRFVATNYPASGLLNMAWRLPNGRVIGAPDWTSRINYDIDARGDVSSDTVWRAKLQAMLRDRFQLVAHLDKRAFPSITSCGSARIDSAPALSSRASSIATTRRRSRR